MRVAGIGIDADRRRPLLVLVESQGRSRVLPIWIAEPEAFELTVAAQHVSRPRPGTHELILAVLAGSGRRLTRVAITELRDSIYFAELVLDNQVRISARPSDAVTLALLADTPIQAHETVLDIAASEHGMTITFDQPDAPDPTAAPESTPDEPDTHARVQEFRDFLDAVDPDDFGTDPDR
ncbi:bifunctional nuclease family protein [Pseudonocardia parietis]|uniref:Bifunctional DNase/RNase n=1 Tax=Pseudonocardia parietis TaxID=570936 RepID=A0ABS4VX34_9PSEU|nr:bifunctional nuclease family protein [Pseudonocardia parietis]MBP2368495.1 bifunctional DNase/RNase [Pseudonocardia parietis]